MELLKKYGFMQHLLLFYVQVQEGSRATMSLMLMSIDILYEEEKLEKIIKLLSSSFYDVFIL
jgi:hypothetical protein